MKRNIIKISLVALVFLAIFSCQKSPKIVDVTDQTTGTTTTQDKNSDTTSTSITHQDNNTSTNTTSTQQDNNSNKNEPPVVSLVKPYATQLKTGETKVYQFKGEDKEGNFPITVEFEGSSTTLAIESADKLAETELGFSKAGIFALRFRGKDSLGAVSEYTEITLTVTDATPQKHVPNLQLNPQRIDNASPVTKYEISVLVTDSGNDVQTIYISQNGSTDSLDYSYGMKIPFTTPASGGIFSFEVWAEDAQGNESNKQSVVVIVTAPNHPPTLNVEIPPGIILPGSLMAFAVTGSDEDGPSDYPLTAYGKGPNGEIACTTFTPPATIWLKFTAPSTPGEYFYTFYVADAHGLESGRVTKSVIIGTPKKDYRAKIVCCPSNLVLNGQTCQQVSLELENYGGDSGTFTITPSSTNPAVAKSTPFKSYLEYRSSKTEYTSIDSYACGTAVITWTLTDPDGAVQDTKTTNVVSK